MSQPGRGAGWKAMRVVSIDIVRAMAIVFVVVGHSLIFADRGGFIMGCIYSFHMPLMFVLSGFVAAASWERRAVPSDWCRAASKVVRSARRLLVPYAVCGLVVVPVVNLLLTHEFARSFANGWRNAFLFNRFLWYLPCCFLLVSVFAAVAAAARGIRGARWFAAAAAAFALLLLLWLLLPEVDYLRSAISYFASFFAGAWLWTRREVVLSPSRWLVAASAAALAALAVLHAATPQMSIFAKGAVKTAAGVASLFPLMAVANSMGGPLARAAADVGRMTLFLYCFDFCATPVVVRYFTPDGTLLAFALAFGVVGLGVFVKLAWSYAIAPELGRMMKGA